MGLKERLLARQAGAGNSGNNGNEAPVTGKAVIKQGGNRSNSGNSDLRDGRGKEPTQGVAEAKNLSRATSYKTVTTVTSVTGLKTKGKSGNSADDVAVTAVTDPADWQGEYEPAQTRQVLYRRFGDAVMWPHVSGCVPAALPDLFAAAAWLDDEGYGPVSVIEAALA